MTHVLLGEDNRGDVILVREALSAADFEFELTVQQDGERMLTHIDLIDKGERACPHVVLLDLNLPKTSGHALLERMRAHGLCKDIPVIIVTSSDSVKDREQAVQLGASDYFRKATDFDEFMRLGILVRRYVKAQA